MVLELDDAGYNGKCYALYDDTSLKALVDDGYYLRFVADPDAPDSKFHCYGVIKLKDVFMVIENHPIDDDHWDRGVLEELKNLKARNRIFLPDPKGLDGRDIQLREFKKYIRNPRDYVERSLSNVKVSREATIKNDTKDRGRSPPGFRCSVM